MKTISLLLLLLSTALTTFSQPANKPKVPDWVNSAVFYEIYPQTFYDANGDGIGDLQGIIQKLDYVKSLGTNAIWLNPFYESPYRDAGYDVSDYYKVGARYGTNADAKMLFDEAHKKGLKIIIDFVPGHTSSDHPWFKESAKQEPNKYSNWFIWTNTTWNTGGSELANNAISGYSDRNGCYIKNFFWHQPALNFGFGSPDSSQKWQLPANHPDVLALREEMKKIMRFWLDMGCDGFRVDMAGSIIRRDKNGEGFKFWQEVKAMFEKNYPNTFWVSEWSNPKDAIKAGFTADFFHWFPEYSTLFRAEDWRSANGFSYEGNSFFDQKGKGDISAFIKAYMDQYNAVKDKGYISLPVGNHDLSRINIQRSDKDLEIISAFLLAMPGVPFLYYGDEIGMRQLYNAKNKEGAYPPRPGARTPMQWSSKKNKGFSIAPPEKLYFPVDTAYYSPDVEAQIKLPNSLLNKTKKLIDLRRKEKALTAYAEFNIVYGEKDKYPFVFTRSSEGETILIALNPSAKDIKFDIQIQIGKYKLLAGDQIFIDKSKNQTTVSMKGVSYSIIKLQ